LGAAAGIQRNGAVAGGGGSGTCCMQRGISGELHLLRCAQQRRSAQSKESNYASY